MVSPSVVSVSLNDTISATCTAEGGPDNQFTWSAVATDGQVTILQNDPDLVVEVTEVDDTVYRCLVVNAAGFEEANLTVYCKCCSTSYNSSHIILMLYLHLVQLFRLSLFHQWM